MRYGNHGCDPNLWHEDTLTISARRPIAPAKGLDRLRPAHRHRGLVDALPLRLAALPRRSIGRDWQLNSLRAAYAGHWSPLLQARIEGGS